MALNSAASVWSQFLLQPPPSPVLVADALLLPFCRLLLVSNSAMLKKRPVFLEDLERVLKKWLSSSLLLFSAPVCGSVLWKALMT